MQWRKRPNKVRKFSLHFNYDIEKENFTKWGFRNKAFGMDHVQKSVMATTMVVRPKSVGTVTLKSADPLDHPLIDPNYLSHPDDFEAFMEGYAEGNWFERECD